MSVEGSERQPMVEVDEDTIAPNPPLAAKNPASKLSSRVTAAQPLINLKEEPVATDVDEEPKATVGLTVI